MGESAPPFIDEGDDLTSEREIVRMLSLVALVIGYKMIVDAHNTVNVRCMWEVASSSSGMADVGACHTIDVGFLPCSPSMVNAGAHNTIDAQRHVGGALPCLSGMGVDGAHNTIGKMSAPTTCLGSDMLGRL